MFFFLKSNNLVLSGKDKSSGKTMYRCCDKVFKQKKS